MFIRSGIFAALLAAFCLHAQVGVITTVAGTGQRGSSGDGGPALLAQLGFANIVNECDPARFEEMNHISIDSSGALLIADSANNRIRRVAPDGTISTIAGSGDRPSIELSRCSPQGGAQAAGDGGPAAAAKLYGPAQALAMPNGSLLISDQKNNRIRVVNATGGITTVIGSNLHSFYAPGVPATTSPLDWPSSIAVDSAGTIYFAELHSSRVAKVGADNIVRTVAGTGLPGMGADNIAATSSALANPAFVLLDASGNVLIAEQGNHRVRRVNAQGIISTIAGTGAGGYSGDGSPATAAQLNQPNGLALDSQGNLYIADMGNHRVRRVSTDGKISTVAGNGQVGRGADGVPATGSALNYPNSVAVDKNGDLLIADWQNYIVRKVSFGGGAAISPGGVVNAASSLPAPIPLAPGSLISIYGVNFASARADADRIPLPVQLGGTSAQANGTSMPLLVVTPSQINAQLPYNLAEGVAQITVTTASGISRSESVTIGAAAPGIFLYGGTSRAVALNQDGSLNAPETPETRGRVVILYLTGQGLVDSPIAAGDAAPSDRLLRVVLDSSATIGGKPANIAYLGLAPQFVGLAQANLETPLDAAAGTAEVILRINRQSSNAASISLR